MKRYVLPLLLVLLIAVGFAAVSPVLKFKAGTGLSVVITDTTVTYSYTGSGSTARGEIHFTGFANFSNGANDSTNLQLGGTVFHSWGLPYNMYTDRFILRTSQPNGRGPSTWLDDLPKVSTDSALVFRLSRNSSFASGQRAALTVYKVAKNAGLSFTNTAGVFYDMVRFDEAVFPTAGTSTMVLVTISLKKDR